MKTSLILKMNFLLLAMGLTVYFIYQINRNGLSPSFLALFGLKPSAQAMSGHDSNADKAAKTATFSWNWCDTRVAAMIKPDEFKIAQECPSDAARSIPPGCRACRKMPSPVDVRGSNLPGPTARAHPSS